jgi:hypothetical protein
MIHRVRWAEAENSSRQQSIAVGRHRSVNSVLSYDSDGGGSAASHGVADFKDPQSAPSTGMRRCEPDGGACSERIAMTAPDGLPSLREILAAEATRRGALLSFIGLAVSILVVLTLLAAAPVAALIFDDLRLAWLWVALMPMLAIIYLVSGVASHRANGLAQFFPFFALLGLAVWAGTVIVCLIETATEWSALEAFAALAVLGLSGLPLTIGTLGYTEIWRTRANRRIVNSILDALPGGATDTAQVPGSKSPFREAVDELLVREDWISPHCLEIVTKGFEIRAERLLATLATGMQPELYDVCLRTGDDLFHYLLLRSAEEPHRSPGTFPLAKRDLLRRLLTLWSLGTDQQRAVHRAAARRWVDVLNLAADPYHAMLAACFLVLLDDNAPDVSATIARAVMRYRQLQIADAPLETRRGQQAICQHTWLAVTHRALGDQPCFDGWMAMRRLDRQDASLSPVNGEGAELAFVLAQAFLARCYQTWARETHRDWRHGLQSRARSLAFQEPS